MNIKRAFLTAVAVLMVPGFAMAQSAVTFPTSVMPAEAGNPDLTLTCNGGLPLTQTAPAGVTFTVTDINLGDMCSIVMEGGLDTGWETDTVCEFTMAEATEYPCNIDATLIPVDFNVTVDWDISEDADPGVGDDAMVEMMCDGENYTSTTKPAGPMATMPITLPGVLPSAECWAVLTNVGSAVEAGSCGDEIAIGDGDASCTLTATAFYEGIPTLSQYGMAIMVLLMLGVGFVGFRRIV